MITFIKAVNSDDKLTIEVRISYNLLSFNWKSRILTNSYIVNTLSKSYLTNTGITIQSAKNK